MWETQGPNFLSENAPRNFSNNHPSRAGAPPPQANAARDRDQAQNLEGNRHQRRLQLAHQNRQNQNQPLHSKVKFLCFQHSKFYSKSLDTLKIFKFLRKRVFKFS